MPNRETLLSVFADDVEIIRDRAKEVRRLLLACCALRESIPEMDHAQHGDFVITSLRIYDQARLAYVLVTLINRCPDFFTDKGLHNITNLVCSLDDDHTKYMERLKNLMSILPEGALHEASNA